MKSKEQMQKELDELVRIAKEKLDDLNIPYGNVYCAKINTRYTSTWGSCRKVSLTEFEIQISAVLFDERNNNLTGAMSTVLHELIHTCPGCFNHGKKWKEYADIVNRETMYHVSRTNSDSDKMIADSVKEERIINEIKKRKAHVKYKLCCSGCGRYYIYKRKCNVVNNPERYRCSCGMGDLYVIQY